MTPLWHTGCGSRRTSGCLVRLLALAAAAAVACATFADAPDGRATPADVVGLYSAAGQVERPCEVPLALQEEDEEDSWMLSLRSNTANLGRVAPKLPRLEDSKMSLAVSAMLLGTVTFMMLLFYTLNFPDEDIRYYACKTIGDGISIFVAVMMYEALRKFSHDVTGDATRPLGWRVINDIVQFVIWFMVLQLGGAYLARVGEDTLLVRETPGIRGDQESSLRWRELQLRSSTNILAHVAGFAAVSVSAGLQSHLVELRVRSGYVALLLPAMACSMWALFGMAAYVRRKIIEANDEREVSEDLWDRASSDAAEEAWGLAMSFQLVNVLLYFVAGQTSNRHGVIEAELSPGGWRHVSICMLIVACICFVGMPVLASFSKRFDEASVLGQSIFKYISDLVCMSFAWSFLYCARAGVFSLEPSFAVDGIIGRIVVALGVSFLAWFWVLVLDRFADMLVGYEDHVDTHRAVVKIIMSLGVLVGLSWELAFDIASDVLNHQMHSPANLMSISISIGLCILVTPAYLKFVTPMIDDSRRDLSPVKRRGHRTAIFRSMFSYHGEDWDSLENPGEADGAQSPSAGRPSSPSVRHERWRFSLTPSLTRALEADRT